MKKKGKEEFTASGIKKIAYIIVITAGLFWLSFGLLESINSGTIAGFMEGLTFGGIILLAAYVVHKAELVGGILLLGEGVLFLIPALVKSSNIIGSSILGIPLLAAGALFILDYNLKKK